MITIINLNKSLFPYWQLITQNLIDNIKNKLKEKKQILLYLNKRWESGGLMCKDCNYQIKCKNCNVSMNIHKYPKNILLCHCCNFEDIIPIYCPKCNWTSLIQIWVWTQKIEDIIKTIFPKNNILRLDSDIINKEWFFKENIEIADIIIATETINTIFLNNLWLVWFLFFELELCIPEYDIEEHIYNNISYNIKRWSNIIIQTYNPKSEILKILTSWNFKDFMMYTLNERLKYSYPPYKELVYIWVKHKNKNKIQDIIFKLKNKLDIYNNEKIIYFDKELFIKKAGYFFQKIIIKWENIENFLDCIKNEIFKNKEISIEWK